MPDITTLIPLGEKFLSWISRKLARKSNLEIKLKQEKYRFGYAAGGGQGLRDISGHIELLVSNKSAKVNSIIAISLECLEISDDVILNNRITTNTPIRIAAEDLEGIEISFKMEKSKITIEEAAKRKDFIVKVLLKDKYQKEHLILVPFYFLYG